MPAIPDSYIQGVATAVGSPKRFGADEDEKLISRVSAKSGECRNEDLGFLRAFMAYTFAELIGSFFIGFIGSGAKDLALLASGGVDILHTYTIGYAFAAIIFPLILMFSQFGSGHFNPAITLGMMFTDQKLLGGNGRRILQYIVMLVAQFLGYLLSAFFLRWVIGGGSIANALTVPSGVVSDGISVFIESLWTMAIVLACLLLKKSLSMKPVAVSILFAIAIGQQADITGGSFNLMRTLGPAIVEGVYTKIWIYILATFIGPALALALRYSLFNTNSKVLGRLKEY